MSDDLSPELRAELLDDFYAECDDLLGVVRAQLVSLDQLEGRAPEAGIWESLLRSLHSLKGNCAIVGLRVGEALAHAGESFLRGLTRGEIPFDSSVLDRLMHASQRLEQIIAAHRQHQPLPAIDDVVQALGAVPPAGPAAEATPAETPATVPAPSPAAPGGLWQATFSPSAERDRRGVNINAVRQRLATLGEIVRATPRVEAGGSIQFDFAIAMRAAPADPAAWTEDGIVLRAPTVPSVEATDDDAAASSLFIAPSHVVRVDLSRLDELMRITGEMVIHRSRLEERIARTAGDRSALQEVSLALSRSLRDLRQALTRARLVPVAEIFTRLPFVVRDLAQESGKKVRLVLDGQHTEIDKYLVERLKEPLLHLVRNAVSHGIESPAERAAAGKPAEATIRLSAATAGDAVVIHISDDGRGIEAAKVAARAAAAGIELPETLDEAGLLNVLCTPGFSTRDQADRAAGRGVGMAVVGDTIRELAGTLTLTNTPGQGARFSIRLPLTLSIAETIVISAAGQTCAIPQGAIEEIVQVPAEEVEAINGVEVMPYREALLPLVRLRAIFGAEPAAAAQLSVLVVGSERGTTGLVVDRVHGQREVVVRPIRDPLVRVPGVAGATELGDGKPILILDAVTLTSGAVRPRRAARPPTPLQQTVSA